MSHTSPLIVISDHDKLYLELMMDLLTEEGYQVIIADGGASSYQVIREKHADMAILDNPIMQPDSVMTTLTMLRLDPTTEQIPVLICSTLTTLIQDNLPRFTEMGCAVLAKPFNLTEMLQHIQVLLTHQQRNDDLQGSSRRVIPYSALADRLL